MIRPWLIQYVDQIKLTLRLGDHEVILSEESADEGASAQVETIPEMAQSTIKFEPAFESMAGSEIRYYVAHELIHIWFSSFDDVLHAFVPSLSPGESRAFRRSWRRAEERLVDSFARIVAPGLPMPPDERDQARIDKRLKEKLGR